MRQGKMHMEYSSNFVYRARPQSGRHPHMKRENRAKQFMPFAALRGYDETIEEKERLYEPLLTLDDAQREQLDRGLLRLEQRLRQGERPQVTVEYFEKKPGLQADAPIIGTYRTCSGTAEKMPYDRRTLRVSGQTLLLAEVTALWLADEEEEEVF